MIAVVRVRDRASATSARPCVAHEGAGRVVEVGDQVGDPGHHLPQRGGERLGVGMVARDVDPDDACTRMGQGRDRVGVGRALRDGAVAGAEQGAGGDGDTGQGSRHDQHLLGGGGQPAGGVRRSDGLAQDRQPRGVVAGAAEVGRQVGHGPLVGAEHPGTGHGRRAGQVDLVLGQVTRRQQVVAAVAAAGRQAGDASRTLAGDEEAVVAQLGVRAGDRGPADRQRVRELALAGQAYADRHPAVGDQHPEAFGQTPVGRGAVERAQQGGYARGGHDAGHADQ